MFPDALRAALAFTALLLLSTGCDLGDVSDQQIAGGVDGGSDLDADPPADDPEVPQDGSCVGCHGSGNLSAPPNDLAGNVERTAAGVGAHREHLRVSDWRAVMICSDCHVVPAEVGSPGHMDGDNTVELTFSAINPAGTFTAAESRCDNLYCHGNGRADNGSIVFTEVAPMTCTSCHATSAGGGGLQGEHGKHFNEGMDCTDCHNTTVNAARVVIAPELHLNGVRDVLMPTGGTYDAAQNRCTNLACHGDENW